MQRDSLAARCPYRMNAYRRTGGKIVVSGKDYFVMETCIDRPV